MTATRSALEERVLILAPRGRDAGIAAAVLAEAGMISATVADVPALHAALVEGAGLVLVTEEAIRTADLRAVAAWVRDQPSWSDLPFVLVTDRGGGLERNPTAARLSEALGNVTFLERPFHPTTLISVARMGLRGRRRQYQSRTQLAELLDGERRLSLALEAGRLGSWELDLATETLIASDACKAHFGRRPDEAVSYRDLLGSVHPDDRPRMRAQLAVSLDTGADYIIEYRNLWPDGSQHWLEVRALVLHDAAGAPARLVGVSTDVTARKEAEATLLQLNETLEQRVRERTLELERAHAAMLEQIAERERAEAQLRQAQKMETIGQLTGNVAHDFNNLLMAVMANLEMLRKRMPADEDDRTRLLDTALQGAQRGAALTQRLLAFARRQDLRIQPVDLVALVRGMSELLRRSAGPRIGIGIELPESLPPAMADPNQVELALLNLVVNARDAMPDGGPVTITLDTLAPPPEEGLAPGPYLRLAVTDAGVGMDALTLERSIEPFFSTKELGKGTGLGLSMIHGLAKQSNGALRLSSAPGQGTKAELWLPAASRPPETAHPAAVSETPPERKADRFTILVVDDDHLVSMGTVAMLEDMGHTVLEAHSGPRALEILRAGQPIDLLVTDHAMPEMTGIQLAQAARAMRPGLPVLLATGYADLPEGIGADIPRLGKPYQQRQLAAHIRGLLGRHGGPGQPQA